MKRSWLLAAAVLLLCVLLSATAGAEFQITGMKTLGRVNPLGIDDLPSFSWQMSSGEIGAAQSAYQIVVQEGEHTVWDSGKVFDADSTDILYAGEVLKPETAYTWQVTVWNQRDEASVSETAAFETALMDATFASWDGAEWIGAGELSLDAASKAVFHIAADVQLLEGSQTLSFILGAEDFRLKNQAFNSGLMAGENYVRVELDFSKATAEGGVKINAYRCGYFPGDDSDVPFASIACEELDALLTAENQYDVHHVDIFCTASTLTLTIDGTELTTKKIEVNALGTSNTYPNLNSVGFAARPGNGAVFTNYTISNGGRFARGTLLDAGTGTGLSIFEGLPGITVEGNAITVEGGKGGTLVYADPSHGAAPMLRRSFELEEVPARARLYLTAQGIYDFSINGQAIGAEDWFNPGSTEYDSLLAYSVYDVTECLSAGENVMGAVLGEGWWTGMTTFECLNNNYYGDQPALMARLVMDFADGSRSVIVSDPDWKVYEDGPVRLASLFQGERIDSTKEPAVAGYDLPDYDDSAWKAASVIETRKQFASPRLAVRYDEPVHVIRTTTAVSCLGETIEGSGAYIYDMGENVSGVPMITIPKDLAQSGETVTLRFAEILYPDLPEYEEQGINGLMMVENLRTALATDFYTMHEGENIFAPDLTFHGYRYIEITGLEAPLSCENVQMRVLSSLDATASYESDNPLVNRLFANIVNSTTSNYISIPTDCPQRDERMGWTGDAQVFALSGSYVADTYSFMRQWMDTVRADCGPTGLSSQYCPAFINYDLEADDTILHKGQSFGITWNCLVVTIPYNLYLQSGNPAIVRDNIDLICTYVDHLLETPLSYKNADGEKVKEPRLTGETGTLCDHLSRIPTDGVSLGNAVFIACLDEAAVMADAVGRTEKADAYRAAAIEAREAWNELFIDPETGKTRNAKCVIQDTQASYATPIRFGVISEANLPLALEHYARTIENPDIVDSDGLAVPAYSITTGFNATGNVLNALSNNGMNDIAFRLFESTEYASWLYPVTQGATSIWERWNGYTNELGFNGNNGMNSFNHYSFGAVYEWMIGYQVGILADAWEPGYQHFILQPTVGGSFTHISGSYDSPYGCIESGWTAEGGQMTGYHCVVPANTSATLYLPASAYLAGSPEGITMVGEIVHNGQTVLQMELAAGTYTMTVADGTITVSE